MCIQLLLLGALNSTELTNLSRRLACISHLFRIGRGWQAAKNVLQLEINIWDSLAEIRDNFFHLREGVPNN